MVGSRLMEVYTWEPLSWTEGSDLRPVPPPSIEVAQSAQEQTAICHEFRIENKIPRTVLM